MREKEIHIIMSIVLILLIVFGCIRVFINCNANQKHVDMKRTQIEEINQRQLIFDYINNQK